MDIICYAIFLGFFLLFDLGFLGVHVCVSVTMK